MNLCQYADGSQYIAATTILANESGLTVQLILLKNTKSGLNRTFANVHRLGLICGEIERERCNIPTSCPHSPYNINSDTVRLRLFAILDLGHSPNGPLWS
jgi:hypothetical protein